MLGRKNKPVDLQVHSELLSRLSGLNQALLQVHEEAAIKRRRKYLACRLTLSVTFGQYSNALV